MTQREFLEKLCKENKDAAIIGSIGTISYDLKDIPHPNKILVKGAMGHAMAVGFGYALAKPQTKVYVIIGDGSYLMKMGSISTVLANKLTNLEVIVINNNSYKSCGGQETNFEAIRHLCPFTVIDA